MRSRHGFDFDTATPCSRSHGTNMMGCVIVVIIVVTVLVGGILQLCGGVVPHYSDGERTGVVTKISKKGWFRKSHEGSMNVGGMAANSDGVMVPVVWEFSVRNAEVVKAVEAAATNATRVTLHYHQYGIKPLSLSTGYVIDGVKVGTEWVVMPPIEK